MAITSVLCVGTQILPWGFAKYWAEGKHNLGQLWKYIIHVEDRIEFADVLRCYKTWLRLQFNNKW